jgi:hypothetical protein
MITVVIQEPNSNAFGALTAAGIGFLVKEAANRRSSLRDLRSLICYWIASSLSVVWILRNSPVKARKVAPAEL